MLFYRFWVFCFLSFSISSSFQLDNFSFFSQNFSTSHDISVWRSSISRSDLSLLTKLSRYGFNSEDDLIVLLQFLLLNLKSQNLYSRYSKSINIPFLVGIEDWFTSFADNHNFVFVPTSKVVDAFGYIIKKSDSLALSKIEALQSSALQNFSSVKDLFSNLGPISISVFESFATMENGLIVLIDESNIKDRDLVFINENHIRSGVLILIEETDAFHLYYIDSDPYFLQTLSNVKASIKDHISLILDTVADSDLLHIEN